MPALTMYTLGVPVVSLESRVPIGSELSWVNVSKYQLAIGGLGVQSRYKNPVHLMFEKLCRWFQTSRYNLVYEFFLGLCSGYTALYGQIHKI